MLFYDFLVSLSLLLSCELPSKKDIIGVVSRFYLVESCTELCIFVTYFSDFLNLYVGTFL